MNTSRIKLTLFQNVKQIKCGFLVKGFLYQIGCSSYLHAYMKICGEKENEHLWEMWKKSCYSVVNNDV